jgi:hypothetical protein
MTGDWRDYRPAIWLTMIGIAVSLLVSPAYIGAIFLGFAIGAAIRIRQRRRRAAAAATSRPGKRSGKRPRKDRSRSRRR